VKLLLLVVPRELRDDAEAALETAAGAGFTEIPGVYGEGRTGPRFGSRQAPGVSDLVFAAVPDEKLPAARQALVAVGARHGQPLRAFVLPVEEAWS
jgi:hypothetical protein